MIKDVHHVGIAVRNLDRACAFFRDALRLPLVQEGVAEARGARVCVLGVFGSFLELIAPTEPSSPFAKHIAEHGEGLHHVALWTDDVEGDVARLRACDVALEDRAPREGFTGRLSYLAPEAFDGVVVEVVEPNEALSNEPARETTNGSEGVRSHVSRVDHVVLRVPDPEAACRRFGDYFGVRTKRTLERGSHLFAFLRPGNVIIEIIGPKEPTGNPAGHVAGLAFEVTGIDALVASLKEQGYPAGDPHPALQGGRIASVHPTGTSGVPVAFIDFAGAERPRRSEPTV